MAERGFGPETHLLSISAGAPRRGSPAGPPHGPRCEGKAQGRAVTQLRTSSCQGSGRGSTALPWRWQALPFQKDKDDEASEEAKTAKSGSLTNKPSQSEFPLGKII